MHATPDSGYGLTNMRERAQAIGGDLTIESGAGGTRLTLRLVALVRRDSTGVAGR